MNAPVTFPPVQPGLLDRLRPRGLPVPLKALEAQVLRAVMLVGSQAVIDELYRLTILIEEVPNISIAVSPAPMCACAIRGAGWHRGEPRSAGHLAPQLSSEGCPK